MVHSPPRGSLLIAGVLTLLTLPALAQQSPTAPPASGGEVSLVTPRHALARAAGYRALHLCTGTFSSGLSEAMVERTMGNRAAGELSAVVDRERRLVTVTFADDMEPRIAAWRPALGCTQLPIGASRDLAERLPRFPATIEIPRHDDAPWPMGDTDAMAALPPATEAVVDSVLDEAFKNQEGLYKGNTWGVVVVKDGRIVAERYAAGWNLHTSSRTHSMCKSIGASLVGVGVQQGLLDIRQKAPLEAWRTPGDPRGQITLNHLLHMASGLYTEAGRNPQAEIYGSGAPAAEVSMLNIMDSNPGERFVYAGSDTILATRALREALDDDEAWISYPHREFLWKLGMTRTLLETDWKGDFNVSGQCWSTARDFGRFGMLYLADGVWNGERILPEGWAGYVSTLAPAQPASRAQGRAGYGAQFWVYGGIEGLPDIAYSPGGALGQYAMIVPSANTVIVRRGLDVGGGFNIARFSADVLAALARPSAETFPE